MISLRCGFFKTRTNKQTKTPELTAIENRLTVGRVRAGMGKMGEGGQRYKLPVTK